MPTAENPASGASADDVRAALLDVVSQKTGYPADMLDLDMDVEADLGIDSIKRVEIMGVLQERFPSPTPVGPEQLAELRTLGEIVDFVLSLGGVLSDTPKATATVAATAPRVVVSTADIAAALLGVVSEKTGYPAETLDLDMDVEADLGIDSIKRVEIMGVLQERFPSPTPVGPEQLAELRTLNEIVGFVFELNAPAAPAASSAEPSVPAASSDDVRAALLDVVSQKTGYPADMLDLGMDVEADLGIDSIKRVEIMGVLQERFPSPTPVGPEQLAELRTLSDIVGFVTGLSGSPEPATPPRHEPKAETDAPPPVPSAAGRPRSSGCPFRTSSSGRTPRTVSYSSSTTAVRSPRPRRPGSERPAGRCVSPAARRAAARLGAQDTALTGWGATELAARVEESVTGSLHLVLVFAAADDLPWAEGVRRLAHTLLIAKHTVTLLTAAAQSGHRAAFVTVTRLDGSFGHGGVAEDAAPAGGVGGLVKTLAVEAPTLFCRALDLSPALGAAEAAGLVLEEVYDAAAGPVQVGRDGTRRVGLTLGEGRPRPPLPAPRPAPAICSSSPAAGVASPPAAPPPWPPRTVPACCCSAAPPSARSRSGHTA
ncbi:phosphopantetheine-binding protein [Streptomyces diastatochromogenes]|nr:phosphopantetheine-binding protein [Streptomyces diastatochromogenes]